MQVLNAVCTNYLHLFVSNQAKSEANMNQTALLAPDIDADYVLWLEHQITLIRERQFAQLDLDNLLDELESLVKTRKTELRSRLRVLIMHLLKWEYQPWLRSTSWVSTIITQRRDIESLLEENPSFRRLIGEYSHKEHRRAARDAVKETGLAPATFPAALPYSEEQLLDHDFFP